MSHDGGAPDAPDLPAIAWLDGRPPEVFAEAVAPLFEGAPRFLARLAAARPFGDWPALFTAARATARSMPLPEQVELIDAHPRLGAAPASVSALSYAEQGYAREMPRPGDGSSPPAEGTRAAASAHVAAELERLNAAYEARFGFRYCVFVAGRPRAELVPGFEAALAADRDAEVARAMEAVVDIAEDRRRALAGPG